MEIAERYYCEPAAAYVRSRHPGLAGESDVATVAAGLAGGAKLYPFKRTAGLPRVRAALGALHAFQPATLLDIGPGRGVFLWPLLEEFPDLHVTAVDVRADRVAVLEHVGQGGIARLRALHGDANDLSFDTDAFEICTALEVLEHMETPATAAGELVRVARRAVVASVPSREDNNPEHIQLFDHQSLGELFIAAGARNVNTSHVLNHIICVATL